MAISYTITSIEGDHVSVQYDDGSWARFRVTAGMTQEQVDDLAYQFGPKPVTVAPDFLTTGATRQAKRLDYSLPDGSPAPEVDQLNILDEPRAFRSMLLNASDWTQLPDAPVNQTAWAAYRQELRDLTQQAGFPDDIDWPEPPTE